MKWLKDNIDGYINIGDDTYTCHYHDMIVTLLPACDNDRNQLQIRNRLCDHDTSETEFYYGYADSYYVAFMRKGSIDVPRMGYNLSSHFLAKTVIVSRANCGYYENIDNWKHFRAMDFYGGSINAIIPPWYALSREEENECMGGNFIRIRPKDEYSFSQEVIIGGEQIKVSCSIKQDNPTMNNSDSSYRLGELSSYIRFEFSNEKEFESIEKYYKIIRQLIALLTMQSNVTFGIRLFQKTKEGKLDNTANCHVNESYENYVSVSKSSIVSLYQIKEGLQRILNSIANRESEIIVDLLPDNNKKKALITITNVQNMCAALEVAYSNGDRHVGKDAAINDLRKRIKQLIKEYSAENGWDVYRETNINSCFEYLDYTLANKINELYSENQLLIDCITRKRGLPSVSLEGIRLFTKARNGRSHDGIIDFKNSAEIYMPLLAIVYVEFFRRAEIGNATIQGIVDTLF